MYLRDARIWLQTRHTGGMKKPRRSGAVSSEERQTGGPDDGINCGPAQSFPQKEKPRTRRGKLIGKERAPPGPGASETCRISSGRSARAAQA
jgi:hypothetical protein